MSKAALAAGGIAVAAGAVGVTSQIARHAMVAGPAAPLAPDAAVSFVPWPLGIAVPYQPPPPELAAAPPTDVPEPASLAILLSGAGAALLSRRRPRN